MDLIDKESLGWVEFAGDLDRRMLFDGTEDARKGDEWFELDDSSYPTPRDVLLNNDNVRVLYEADTLADLLDTTLGDYSRNSTWFTIDTPATSSPSTPPSLTPSSIPRFSSKPSVTPTAPPTLDPTTSSVPSVTPTFAPSFAPSATPSATPSALPTQSCGEEKDFCLVDEDCCSGKCNTKKEECKGNRLLRKRPLTVSSSRQDGGKTGKKPKFSNPEATALWDTLVGQDGETPKDALRQIAKTSCGPDNPYTASPEWIAQMGFDPSLFRCWPIK